MQRFRAFTLAFAVLGVACATGAIVAPEDDSGTTPGGDAGTCTKCGNACADTKVDPANCGKCGAACPIGATCVQGACQCGSAQVKCGNACVDTKTEVANCGKCGNVCGLDAGAILGGGTWGCSNGTCSIVCPMGKTECNGACVDTKTDNDNCGMCNTPCTAMTEQCSDGLCCKLGETACSAKCTDTQTDPLNCGKCANACGINTPYCAAGTCTAAIKCSVAATNYCTGKGWKVVSWSTSFPNQPGGSIFCTSDGRSAGNDCDGCGTYNQIVWKNVAKDACSSAMSLVPGNVYTGHTPCTCQANNPICGQWPSNGCIPD